MGCRLSIATWPGFRFYTACPTFETYADPFTLLVVGPGGNCWLDPINPVPSVTDQNIQRFNKNNRTLLGVLQLVAKLLEIWFVIVAGG
jgi:hypothetical protein